jgi:predicted phage gp36 major capsid-like protein
MSTGNGVIAVGDPFYYALVDRVGLSIDVNPYLYQATGQVGYFARFRQSGKVLYSLAWCIGQMA